MKSQQLNLILIFTLIIFLSIDSIKTNMMKKDSEKGFRACAVDFHNCSVPANQICSVKYGARGRFKYIHNVVNWFKCLPNTFRIPDPFPGVQKTWKRVWNSESVG